MAAVAIQQQLQFSIGSSHYTLTTFVYNASGETCVVPTGCVGAGAVVHESTTTAPTSVTISAGATSDTLTITGGTVGKALTIFTRHTGGPASGR